MAVFQATHSLQLSGWTLSGHSDNPLVPGTLSWTGWSETPFAGEITDNGQPGALDRNDDFFGSASNSFTGYFVTIGGQNFGIFKVGNMRVIPYNAAEFDITQVFANAPSSTNAFSTALTGAANCFVAGTRIATPSGARPIESLRPGDTILTAEGGATSVIWPWRQTITHIVGLHDDFAPVRIAAHALGPGCPARELTVTRDHALRIEGFLINAGALVNGTTIRPVPLAELPAKVSYWHLETEAHSLILAENCAAESFAPYGGRSGFDDHAAYLARYGHDRLYAERQEPRITSARLLPAQLRARLAIAFAA